MDSSLALFCLPELVSRELIKWWGMVFVEWSLCSVCPRFLFCPSRIDFVLLSKWVVVMIFKPTLPNVLVRCDCCLLYLTDPVVA